MTPSVHVRYHRDNDEFMRRCRARVHRYFEERGVSRYATPGMYTKTILLLTVYVGAYVAILSNAFRGWGLFLLQMSFHFCMFQMAVGIAHDGSHNAYSRHPRVNKAVALVFDLVGINSHFWSYNHLHSHHAAPNVPQIDSAVESFSIVRLHPLTPRTRAGRYQHLYMFGVYSLVTLFQLLVIELLSFRQRVVGYRDGDQHTRHQLFFLYASKIGVITYTLVVPLLVVDVPAWQLIAGFVAGHMISGLALGVIFQTTHLCDHAIFPEPDADNRLPHSFPMHILLTTSEFSVNSSFVTWIAGGLNLHVTHHLFPGICHTHLGAISRIVRETATELGLPYKHYSLWGALASHLRTLRRLGNAPSYVPVRSEATS